MNKTDVLTIFYDGACGVCATEMKYYRGIAGQNLAFIDISADDFQADKYERTDEDFQRELHVRNSQGEYFTGVEAFRALWNELPSPFYPLLSSFVGLPGVNLASRIGYHAFAKVRHLLPGTRTCKLPEQN